MSFIQIFPVYESCGLFCDHDFAWTHAHLHREILHFCSQKKRNNWFRRERITPLLENSYIWSIKWHIRLNLVIEAEAKFLHNEPNFFRFNRLIISMWVWYHILWAKECEKQSNRTIKTNPWNKWCYARVRRGSRVDIPINII